MLIQATLIVAFIYIYILCSLYLWDKSAPDNEKIESKYPNLWFGIICAGLFLAGLLSIELIVISLMSLGELVV